MKYLEYIFMALTAISMAGACEKHQILFDTDGIAGNAEFKISCFVPVAVNADNQIESVYVNGVFYAGISAGTNLAVNGTLPAGPGRFFTAPAGGVNVKLFRKDRIAYDKDMVLKAGKQNIFIYDLEKDPFIVEEAFPYTNTSGIPAGSETFDTDSVASVRFLNLVWEKGEPFVGKVQYQWRDNTDEKDEDGNYFWHDLGEPVGFGEVIERCLIIIHKSIFNSAGYARINYRTVNAESGKQMSTDYWNGYIGRVYTHVYRHNLDGSPKAAFTQINDK